MIISVTINNLERIMDVFGSNAVAWVRDRSIKKAIFTLERFVKPETPLITGRLRNGYQSQFMPWYGRLFNPVKYAVYVHDWTRPYVITPTNKKALFWKTASHPVRSVKHPWIKANPFMDRAIAKLEPVIDKIFEDEIDALFKKI